jgi:hypothetical protein
MAGMQITQELLSAALRAIPRIYCCYCASRADVISTGQALPAT